MSAHRFDLWILFFTLPAIAGLLAGSGLILAFGLMGLLAGLVAWLWNRVSLEEVSYERRLAQDRAFIGDEVDFSVTLINRKPVPLGWVRVEDQVPPEIQVVSAQVGERHVRSPQVLSHSTSMAWYERVRWDYILKCNQRGFYRIGPARIHSGDLFGFFSGDKESPDRDSLLIYPKVVPLQELGVPAFKPLGEAKSGVRMFQDISRPASVRDYQRGDALKWVDWKLSAKVGRLQVRTFDPSSSTTLVLVAAIETSATAGYSPELLERVITAAASLASYAIEHGYVLGLFSNGSHILADRPMILPPSRDPQQLTLVLEALATITPLVMSPIARKLAEHSRRFPIGATLVIVTAMVRPDLASVILDLKERGHPVVVLYVGDEPCPDLPEGVLVHELGDHLKKMELASEFGPG